MALTPKEQQQQQPLQQMPYGVMLSTSCAEPLYLLLLLLPGTNTILDEAEVTLPGQPLVPFLFHRGG